MKRSTRRRYIRLGATIFAVHALSCWLLGVFAALAFESGSFACLFAGGELNVVVVSPFASSSTDQDPLMLFSPSDNIHFDSTKSEFVSSTPPPRYCVIPVMDFAPRPKFQYAFPDIEMLESDYYWKQRQYGFGRPTVINLTAKFNRYFGRDGSTSELSDDSDIPVYSLHIPLGWVLVLATFTQLIAILKTNRFPSGHCQQCNYDLAENTSGICPECGEGTVGQVIT